MTGRSRLPLWLFFLLLLSPSSSWGATDKFPAFDFVPSATERYFFSVASSHGPFRSQFSLGVSNQFLYRPFDLLDSTTGLRLRSVIDSAVIHFLSGTYGLTDSWDASLTFPVISRARFDDPTVATSPGTETLTRLGDLRLTSRVRLVDNSRHRWGLAAEPFLGIPLGADDRYLGDSKPLGGLRLLADLLATERIRLALNLGAEFREKVILNNIDFEHRFLTGLGLSGNLSSRLIASAEMQANTTLRSFFSERAVSPVEFLGGIRWDAGRGFQVGAGGGTCGVCGARGAKLRTLLTLGYQRNTEIDRLREEHQVEMQTFTLEGKSAEEKQYAAALYDLEQKTLKPEIYTLEGPAAREHIQQTIYLLREKAAAAASPEESYTLQTKAEALQFALAVYELKQECPADAEEFDPSRHDAGCPKFFELREGRIERYSPPERRAIDVLSERDSDRDTIPNLVDRCPTEAEVFNEFEDTDGCPDKLPEKLKERAPEKPALSPGPVYFGFNASRIDESGTYFLRKLAKLLSRQAKKIGRIRVTGHTDNVGSEPINRSLSLNRAEETIRRLYELGVPASIPLEPEGKGESEPAASNLTQEGRDRNRRVTFEVLSPP